ncbi:MAG: hypothetical protein M1396_03605 [Chloroflexi bacterium]|nr:hypothetical protein [Chloroflexota bacterium]
MVGLFLLVIIRIFHLLAAITWVGGMIFFIGALQPALKSAVHSDQQRLLFSLVNDQMREVSQVSSIVLIFTGAILTFDRLSQPHLHRIYAVILALKVLLSVIMMVIASGLARRTRRQKHLPHWLSAPYVVLVLGLAVSALAVILQVIFDVSYGATS